MEKDILTGLLTKAYNKSSDEIAELLYDKSADSEEVTLKEDALNLVLDLDEKRVNRLKSDVKPDGETLKQIHDRSLKEAREEFEKEIKKKYGMQSSSKGLDLIQEIVDQVSECDISDEKVKSHPLYLELEQLKSKEDYEALQQEFEEYKSNQDRMARLGRIRSDALGIFSGLNAIESPNQVVATNRREDFLRKFESYDYELKDDGNHLILRNGARLEDKHANPIRFADFVKDQATLYYDFAQSGDKGNAGNQPVHTSRIGIPKTKEEYLKQMSELMLKGMKEDAAKLNEAWKSQNP